MSRDADRKLMTAEEAKAALWHYFYRNHKFSPGFCSGCEMVERAIDEYSGAPPKLKWCKPEIHRSA